MKVEQTLVSVVIFTENNRVEGKLHLPAGGRLTDYLALAERKFLPLTDVQIYHLPTNEKLYDVAFANVNKDLVSFIFPKYAKGEDNV